MASKRTTPSTAEKDRIVYSANWKETAILQKKLQVLEISKRKVERRLSMDQKIVNKRFQQKIFRSRVSHARMWGDREKIQELLQRDRFTLNTSLNGDDKYEVNFRSRHSLLRRPKSVPNLDSRRRDVSVRPATAVPSADAEDSLANPEEERLASSTVFPEGSVKVRPMTAFTASKKHKRQALEPTKTAETERPRPYTAGNSADVKNTQTELFEEVKEKGEPDVQLPLEENSKLVGVSFTNDSGNGKVGIEERPITAGAGLTRPKSKRKSVSALEKSQQFSGGLFEEDTRPTLREIDRQRVRSARYPQRVQSFTNSLRPLRRDWEKDVDYYTQRVAEMALRESRHKFRYDIYESEGERRDAKRSVGDIRSRNMTFGSVSEDYYRYFRPADNARSIEVE